jgi:hypothetical protein
MVKDSVSYFQPTIQFLRDATVKRDPVELCDRTVQIVVELIKTGNLCRLYRLVDDKCVFDRFDRSSS